MTLTLMVFFYADLTAWLLEWPSERFLPVAFFV